MKHRKTTRQLYVDELSTREVITCTQAVYTIYIEDESKEQM